MRRGRTAKGSHFLRQPGVPCAEKGSAPSLAKVSPPTMTALASEDGSRKQGAATARAGHHADVLKVVLWMIGALLCFSSMALSIPALPPAPSIFEILSIRSGAGLLILLGLLVMRPGLRHGLAPRHMRLHALRNSVHFAAQCLGAQALLLLPLATVLA